MKKLSIITVMLVLLGGGLWLFNNDSFSPDGKSETNTAILPKLEIQELSSIFIKGKDGTVELVKEQEDRWKVKNLNYEADTQKIRNLLLKLMRVKRGDIVTKNPAQYSLFELTDLTADQKENSTAGAVLSLRREGGPPLLSLVLGKSRNGGAGQYIRYSDQPAVYVIPEKIWLDFQNDNWLNKTIVDIDGKKRVKKMTLNQAGKIFSFEREKADSEWKTHQSGKTGKLNQSEITSLSGLLNGLNFSKILPANTSQVKTGRQKLAYFTAELFDGRVFKLTLGEKKVKDDGTHYCTVEMDLRKNMTDKLFKQEVQSFNQRSNPWLYGLGSWQADKFLKKRSEFINKEKK